MKIIAFLLVFLPLLAACAAPTSIATPTPAPVSTKGAETETLAAGTPTMSPTLTPDLVTMDELGITDYRAKKTFEGMPETLTREADGSYSVTAKSNEEGAITEGKYTIDITTFDFHLEMKNFYSPGTVEATDEQGNKVRLIWNNELGWVKEFTNLSTDIENPTEFDYEYRVPMLQSLLLQHESPFKPGGGLDFRLRVDSENSKVIYFRTDDNVGNLARVTDYWLKVKMPNGESFIVNPVDIDNEEGRAIILTAYGKNATKDADSRAKLQNWIKDPTAAYWFIVSADPSFLENFQLVAAIDATDYSDLNYLFELQDKDINSLKFGKFMPNDLIGRISLLGSEFSATLPQKLQTMILPVNTNMLAVNPAIE
ncbi:MAG: hypothetical protein JW963_26005 [Anaerolineales bacterium]|nr:hypothetical protein [Anaerolineales bacterium]